MNPITSLEAAKKQLKYLAENYPVVGVSSASAEMYHVTPHTLNKILRELKDEGYSIFYIEYVQRGNRRLRRVLARPGIGWAQAYKALNGSR